MVRFHYTARDAQGHETAGWLSAADEAEALAQLEAQGMQPGTIELRPDVSAGSLSPADAATLSRHLAGAVRSELPLHDALEALAEPLGGRLAATLRRAAAQLRAGRALADVLASPDIRLPPDLALLVALGTRAGKLEQVLDAYADQQEHLRSMRRRLWAATAYPLLLGGLFLAVAIFFLAVVVPPVVRLGEEFGLYQIESGGPNLAVQLTLAASQHLGLVIAFIGAMVAAGGLLWTLSKRSGTLRRIWCQVPLLGKLWRYHALVESCQRLALLLENEVPLVEALRRTAAATPDADLRGALHTVALRCEGGQPLAAALCGLPQIPATMVPLVAWGESVNALPAALHTTAEAFAQRFQVRHDLLRGVLPPVMLVLLCAGCGLLLGTALAPLLEMLQLLSAISFETRFSTDAGDAQNVAFLAGLGLLLAGAVVMAVVRGIQAFKPGWLPAEVRIALHASSWMLIALGLLVVPTFPLGWLNLFYGFILVAVAVLVFNRLRDARRTELLCVVQSALSRQLPLIPSLEAYAAESELGGEGALALAGRLRRGAALSDALRSSPWLLPGKAALAVRLGAECGRPGDGFNHWLRWQSQFQDLTRGGLARMFYLWSLLAASSLVMAFMLIKIAPAFERIFSEWEAPLPRATQVLFHTVGPMAPAVAAVGLLCGLLLLVGTGIFVGLIPARAVVPSFLLRAQDSANVLASLRWVVEAGRPLHGGLEILAEHYPDCRAAARVQRVLDEVQSGGDWCDSLCRQRLLFGSDALVLRAAQRAGNLGWALGEMALRRQRRFFQSLQLAGLALFPLAVLGLGLLVAFVAVALVYPLAALTQYLVDVL